MNVNAIVEYARLQSKLLVRLDREAHKKFGDNVYSMTVKKYYGDRFTALVETKDGKTHRMTIKL